MSGTATPNLPLSNSADDLIGNDGGNTVRVALTRLVSILGTMQGPSYATLGELNGDLSWAAGSVGTVFSGSQAGVYRKSGGSGAGSWSKIGDLPVSALSAAQLAEKANASDLSDEVRARINATRDSGVIELDNVVAAGGTITAELTPGSGVTTLASTSIVHMLSPLLNEGEITLNVGGAGVWPVLRRNGSALRARDLKPGVGYLLRRRGNSWRVIGLLDSDVAERAATGAAPGVMVRLTNVGGTADAITADAPPDAAPFGITTGSYVVLRPSAANTVAGPTLTIGGGFSRVLQSETGGTLGAGRLIPEAMHVIYIASDGAARVMAIWTPPGYIDQRLGPVVDRIKTVSAPALRRSTEAQSRVHDLIDLAGGLHLTGLGGKSVQEHITTTQRRLKELARAATGSSAAPARVYDAVHDIGCDPNGVESVSDRLNAFTAAILAGPPLGPVTIFFPRGRYRSNSRIVPRTGINWVGVGPQSIIMPAGTDAAFHNLTSQVYIKHCIFANFAVAGDLQTLTTEGNYSVGTKAFYIQGFRDCLFTDLYLTDSGATSLGIDFSDRSIIQRVRVERGGRLAAVGDLGGSGIGIGTGWLTEEPLIVADCLTEDCRNYGIFLERQHGNNAQHTIIHHNIARRNQYGIGGCGTTRTIYDGNQISDNLNHGLTLHRGTNNASQADDGAIVTNNQIFRNGGAGVDFDPEWRSQASVEAFQSDNNRIEGNAGPGYRILGPTLTSGHRRRGLSIGGDTIVGNGGHGVHVVSGRLWDLDIDGTRIFDNVGSAVRLEAEADITGGSIKNIKARDHRGAGATQTGSITGGAALTDFDIGENHGVGCGPINLTGTQTRVTFGRNPGM